MSALPKAVQKQIAEANRIAAEIKAGSTPPPADPPANPPAAPPASQPAAAAAPPAAAPAASVVTPAGSPPPDESWEKKYRVLQGKYNAEVPRLQTQVREMSSNMQNLQSQLVTTQALMQSLNQRQASAPAQAPAAVPPASARLVKDEEVKTFGPDLYDFIQRAAREVMPQAPAQPNAQVTQQVQQVKQQVDQIASKVAVNDQQKMVALLDEKVPDWSKLNTDEAFLAWLEQPEPYSGVKRFQLFDEAAARFDGPRVAAFFKGFQNEHAPTPTQPQAPAPAAPAASAAPPMTLDRFVAPGTAKAGAAGAPNEAQKRIYTRAEIDAHVTKKNSFVIKGKKVPDALVAEERDIMAAAREGRVSG